MVRPESQVPRIAYLNSKYPSMSHTFIEREIRALRARGLAIDTFSVRPAGRNDRLGAHQARAADETFVLMRSPGELVRRALLPVVRRIWRLPRALGVMWQSTVPGVVGRMKGVAYLLQGAVLARELARRGVRHVHVHMANNGANVAMIACALDPRLSYSLTVHGSAEFLDVSAHRLGVKVVGARFVRAISSFGRAQIMAWCPPGMWDRVHVVRCGIYPDEFAPPARAGAPELRLLSVGRMVPVKAQPLLLRACAGLQRHGVDWRLEFVGSGPMERDLRVLARELGIADRVQFCGPVSQEQLHAVYQRSDILVISSFMEGLPVVAMEAMASGTIVLATAVAGVPELVVHGKTGFACPAGSSEALRDAMVDIWAQRGSLGDIRAAAREKVCREYTAEHTAEGMAALFATYLRESPARDSAPAHAGLVTT